ncbi:hypothetical protein C7M84_001183 [Penaeus vannamei]|uniref:Uncharacterized protein n=1 Tax=Penaeus vannamei TaxID=6689 RepID=A0A423TUJ7_PENVA|nr:hypothetical protein C7M84_001183 [Penaeus vannamei]
MARRATKGTSNGRPPHRRSSSLRDRGRPGKKEAPFSPEKRCWTETVPSLLPTPAENGVTAASDRQGEMLAGALYRQEMQYIQTNDPITGVVSIPAEAYKCRPRVTSAQTHLSARPQIASRRLKVPLPSWAEIEMWRRRPGARLAEVRLNPLNTIIRVGDLPPRRTQQGLLLYVPASPLEVCTVTTRQTPATYLSLSTHLSAELSHARSHIFSQPHSQGDAPGSLTSSSPWIRTVYVSVCRDLGSDKILNILQVAVQRWEFSPGAPDRISTRFWEELSLPNIIWCRHYTLLHTLANLVRSQPSATLGEAISCVAGPPRPPSSRPSSNQPRINKQTKLNKTSPFWQQHLRTGLHPVAGRYKDSDQDKRRPCRRNVGSWCRRESGREGPWRQRYTHQYLFTSLGTTHTSQTCMAFACDHGTAASPPHRAAASMDELDLSGTAPLAVLAPAARHSPFLRRYSLISPDVGGGTRI